MRKGLMFSALLAGLFVSAGCGQKSTDVASGDKKGKLAAKADAKADKEGDNSKHAGWWCDEHGVPESECSMCSSKAAKECKAKGDWCEKHDRAKSQCFICEPSLKDKFAAQYEAKYGKKPPEPDGQKEEKK
ncbi:MAG: hypothetical protein U0798_13685 [Gemmataceae bacterium]